MLSELFCSSPVGSGLILGRSPAMHYMADPVFETVEAKMGPPTRIPDRYLMPQFAADLSSLADARVLA